MSGPPLKSVLKLSGSNSSTLSHLNLLKGGAYRALRSSRGDVKRSGAHFCETRRPHSAAVGNPFRDTLSRHRDGMEQLPVKYFPTNLFLQKSARPTYFPQIKLLMETPLKSFMCYLLAEVDDDRV